MKTILQSRWRRGLLFYFFIIGSYSYNYAQVHLVKDLNPELVSGYPGTYYDHIVNINGTAFFAAYTNKTGVELFKSDGTPEGTMLVKDIVPGVNGSGVEKLTEFKGKLYFTVYTTEHGRELWTTDGTAEGTKLVMEFSAGANDTYFDRFEKTDNALFFTVGLNELWKIESHDVAPVMVKNFTAIFPNELFAFDNQVYFMAEDFNGVGSLWKTDGTAGGTVIVHGLFASLYGFSSVNGQLMYFAKSSASSVSLLKTDGTLNGTVIITTFNHANAGDEVGKSYVVANNILYFTGIDGPNGEELWTSNGTTAQMFISINAGPDGSKVDNLMAINNKVFFTAYTASAGNELWTSDGTLGGTVLVHDINNGSAGSDPDVLTNVNGKLFFIADDGSAGRELWKYDGSSIDLVKDINPGSQGSDIRTVANVGGSAFFWAYTNGETELWKSNGNDVSTEMIKDIGEGTQGAYIEMIDGGSTLFFQFGDKLLVSDGTPQGTIELASGMSLPQRVVKIGDTFYFLSYSDLTGAVNLWKSDGTAAGTNIIGQNFNYASDLIDVNGTLFFRGDDGGGAGRELWRSNGTPETTMLVMDIAPGTLNSDLQYPFVLNGTLYFTANDGTHGYELWKCVDGTANGTGMVKDIIPGSFGASPGNFAILNNTIYFSAWGTNDGKLLWKSDGTELGTQIVKDIEAPLEIVRVGNTIFFTSREEGGYELWQTNGEANGTVRVKDINPGTAGSIPHELIEANGKLFFIADDGVHGDEIWTSDGTEVGTVMVAEMTTGFQTDINRLVEIDGRVFFVHEDRLWKTEGSECNTIPLTTASDASILLNGYNNIIRVNGKLFFAGTTETVADELFYYDFSNVNQHGTCAQTITIERITDKRFGDAPFSPVTSSTTTLPVTFSSSDESVAKVTGNTITIVGVGVVTITATQSGNADYASADASRTFEVTKGDQTITFAQISERSFGAETFTLGASASSGLGITYTSSEPTVATISGSVVTILKAGTTIITARQNGNTLYNSATAVDQLLTVTKVAQVLTFDAVSSKTVGDAAFDLTASTTSGLTIVFVSSNPAVATVSGKRVTIVGAGSTTITASQGGNENYLIAPNVNQVLVVDKKSQSIVFSALPESTFGDEPFTLEAAASSGLPIVFTSSNTAVATITGNSVALRGAGETMITASSAGNATYHVASAEQKLIVRLVTGTDEYNGENEIEVYPNPAADYVIVQRGQVDRNAQINVMNARGQGVDDKVATSSEETSWTLNVQSLPAGIYLITVKTEHGTVTKRLVKK